MAAQGGSYAQPSSLEALMGIAAPPVFGRCLPICATSDRMMAQLEGMVTAD